MICRHYLLDVAASRIERAMAWLSVFTSCSHSCKTHKYPIEFPTMFVWLASTQTTAIRFISSIQLEVILSFIPAEGPIILCTSDTSLFELYVRLNLKDLTYSHYIRSLVVSHYTRMLELNFVECYSIQHVHSLSLCNRCGAQSG